MMHLLRLVSLTIGWVVSYTYPLLLLLAESGTCTQGNTNAYLVSTVLCLMVTAGSAAMIAPFSGEFPRLRRAGLFHLVSLAVYGAVVPRYFYYTTVWGYSPCYGNRYWGAFESASMPAAVYEGAATEDRLFAVVFTLCLAVLLGLSVRAFLQNRASRRPVPRR